MDYDIKAFPSQTERFFIMVWVFIQAFKYYWIGFILLLFGLIFSIRKLRSSK
jgi:hypothetical protein